MEETKVKSVFENISAIHQKVAQFKIEDSNKRYMVVFAMKSYQEIIKIFGREANISKEFRKYIDIFRQPKLFNIDLANEFINRLDYLSKFLNDFNTQNNFVALSRQSVIPTTKNIFIIHGHDETNTLKLYNLLRDEFNLNPIKISNKPGQSRSIIDKFEIDASTCSFAFALFTKDDEVINSENNYLQARPNVFFESGWFTGRLGKDRLVLLLQNGTKIHSDFDGISRIQFEKDINDKFIQIRDELLAAKVITV